MPSGPQCQPASDWSREGAGKKRFADYPICCLHLDIAELRTGEGRLQLPVALDRSGKFACAGLHGKRTNLIAAGFPRNIIAGVPCRIPAILTDNGVQFTSSRRDRRGAAAPVFDALCREHGIGHRLIRVNHHLTNGRVERRNRTPREATARRCHYSTHEQPGEHTGRFPTAELIRGDRLHEPVAALYAYLRSKENLSDELARLEGRFVLVYDWGGGTLDLTLCRILGGTIMQVANLGENEVGGDRFDDRLRNFLREKHARANGIEDVTALEQSGMAAQLLHRCETAKINLSDKNVESARITVRNYLKIDGSGQNLRCNVTREELDQQSRDIVERGLACIDEILEKNDLPTRTFTFAWRLEAW